MAAKLDVNWDDVIEDVEFLLSWNESAWTISKRLGITIRTLERKMLLMGRPDLAHPFGRAKVDTAKKVPCRDCTTPVLKGSRRCHDCASRFRAAWGDDAYALEDEALALGMTMLELTRSYRQAS